jgi:hypothetical protein
MRIVAITLMLLANTAFAQTAAPIPSNEEIAKQVQKLTGKNSKEALGQVMVIGSLLGCTQKTAGKEATQAFYSHMQEVGKTVEGYCKRGHATEARALLLATVTQHSSHPVAHAALGCYDAQKQTVATMGGKRIAADAALYANWIRDPEAAKVEMKETDVCIGYPASKKSAASEKPL